MRHLPGRSHRPTVSTALPGLGKPVLTCLDTAPRVVECATYSDLCVCVCEQTDDTTAQHLVVLIYLYKTRGKGPTDGGHTRTEKRSTQRSTTGDRSRRTADTRSGNLRNLSPYLCFDSLYLAWCNFALLCAFLVADGEGDEPAAGAVADPASRAAGRTNACHRPFAAASEDPAHAKR